MPPSSPPTRGTFCVACFSAGDFLFSIRLLAEHVPVLLASTSLAAHPLCHLASCPVLYAPTIFNSIAYSFPFAF